MIAPRIVIPEALDELAANDPSALRSRRDLARIHHVMGTRSITSKGWQEIMDPYRGHRPLRILEIGAGDGTLLLEVARALSLQWPKVELTLLDKVEIVTPATLAGYADLGWTVRTQVANVLDWAEQTERTNADEAFPKWDLISATLFLHHFEARPLKGLLAKAAACTERFFACEPKRSTFALLGSHLVGAIGANAVTRKDAVLSVRAGFRASELSAHWPDALHQWQLREFAAGLFSHCFSARRIGVSA